MLTDEQIDGLSGRELDRAVAVHCGWTLIGIWWQCPESGLQFTEPRKFSKRDAAAFELLKGCVQLEPEFDRPDSPMIDNNPVSITILGETIEVHDSIHARPLAEGPKSESATVLCRAYLKLKAREQ